MPHDTRHDARHDARHDTRHDARVGPIVGVLLAAGRSRRMGTLKQLLPWPPGSEIGTVVAAALDAIAGPCAQMIVVTGHEAQRVEAALAPRRFDVVRVPAGLEMLDSVRAGLDHAGAFDPRLVLVHPADHPLLAVSTLDTLLTESERTPALAIMPERDGAGGHPVLIPTHLARSVCEWTGEGGLRAFWREHPESCRRVPVDDPGVVRDLDTREDYVG